MATKPPCTTCGYAGKNIKGGMLCSACNVARPMPGKSKAQSKPKVSKKTPLKPAPKKSAKKKAQAKPKVLELTPQQEMFCQLYAQLSDTYSNGTWSYALAYGFDLENAPKDDAKWHKKGKITEHSSFDKMSNVCAANASRLLRNDKVIAKVQELKASYADDDRIVDSRMMDIIFQGKDTDSLAAIKHRNELKQRVIKRLEAKLTGELSVALVEFVGDDTEQS